MNRMGQDMTSARPSLILFMVGVVAILIAGLQPVILGALEHEGRLDLSQIGVAATVELLAIGIACGASAALLPTRRMRLILCLAAAAHGATNLACVNAAAGQLIALRGLSGALAGVMLWSCVAMIARAHRPERLAAAFVTVQTLAQLAIAAILPLTAMAVAGAAGGLASLAALSALIAVVVWRGPDQLADPPRQDQARGLLSAPAWIGLATAFLQMAFIVAPFVYLEPLAAHAGLPQQAAGLATAAVLAAQVTGGLAAMIAGGRLPPRRTLAAAMIVGALALAGQWAAPSLMIFVAASGLFGFAWLFSLPFHTALLIDLDPTRRGAMQLGAAQLLGSACGPLVASLVVERQGIEGVAAFSAVAVAAALAMLVASGWVGRRAVLVRP